LLGVSVLPANVQDRDGGRDLLREARRRFPFVERIFADAGYQGPKMAKAVARAGCWKIEIVNRSNLHRFVVLPKRWVVERSFAWISRNRRLNETVAPGGAIMLKNILYWAAHRMRRS
jgi:transposase